MLLTSHLTLRAYDVLERLTHPMPTDNWDPNLPGSNGGGGSQLPAGGGDDSFSNVHPVSPPNSHMFMILLGVLSFVCFGVLTGLTALSGVKFAMAHDEGHASRGQKMAPLFCGAGAIITATAGTWIMFFSHSS